MSKAIGILKYYYDLYKKSNQIVMPLITWFVFMYFSYTILPVDIVSSTVTSCFVLFFIMVWVSYSYYSRETEVGEQVLMLKVQNNKLYYMMRVVFLVGIGTTFSGIGTGFPLIQHIILKGGFYTRGVTFYDIAIELLFHICFSLLGIMVGGLFQPRVMKDKKKGSFLVLLVSLMGLLKGGLNTQMAWTKFITWLFPPVDNFGVLFRGADYFAPQDVIAGGLTLLGYILVALLLQLYFLEKNRFS